jgi:hypothetical protein
MIDAYKVLVGKPEGKRSRGRSRHRWEDNIMNLREVGWKGVDWIQLAQDGDREEGNEPSGSIKDREFLDKRSDC